MSLAGAQAEGVGAGRLLSHTVMPRIYRKLHSLVAGLCPCASCLVSVSESSRRGQGQLSMFRSEEGHRPCWVFLWLMGRRWLGCSQC